MGFKKSKRPLDLRTKGAVDLKFDTMQGTTGGYVSTRQFQKTGVTTSTGGSTALSARGTIVLGSSSTSAAANWILTPPAAAGEEINVVVDLHGSTFGVTVNASTLSTVTFGKVAATTDQIRVALPGVLGNSFTAISLSASRWLVTAHQGAVFSTGAA